MLRVDVPETTKQPAFTRFFGSGAIYSINPMDENAVKLFAEKLEVTPIQSYDISELLKKHSALLLGGVKTSDHNDDEDLDDDNNDLDF